MTENTLNKAVQLHDRVQNAKEIVSKLTSFKKQIENGGDGYHIISFMTKEWTANRDIFEGAFRKALDEAIQKSSEEVKRLQAEFEAL